MRGFVECAGAIRAIARPRAPAASACAPARRRSRRASPPVRSTRWHGITIGIGFEPSALPAAREPRGLPGLAGHLGVAEHAAVGDRGRHRQHAAAEGADQRPVELGLEARRRPMKYSSSSRATPSKRAGARRIRGESAAREALQHGVLALLREGQAHEPALRARGEQRTERASRASRRRRRAAPRARPARRTVPRRRPPPRWSAARPRALTPIARDHAERATIDPHLSKKSPFMPAPPF